MPCSFAVAKAAHLFDLPAFIVRFMPIVSKQWRNAHGKVKSALVTALASANLGNLQLWYFSGLEQTSWNCSFIVCYQVQMECAQPNKQRWKYTKVTVRSDAMYKTRSIAQRYRGTRQTKTNSPNWQVLLLDCVLIMGVWDVVLTPPAL